MVTKSQVEEFLKVTKQVFRSCEVEPGIEMVGFLPNPRDGKYLYIYTRDFAVCIKMLCEVRDYATAKRACRFMASLQSSSGAWVQRYDISGEEKQEVKQEDSTPLAIWAIMNYIKNSNDIQLRNEVMPIISLGIEHMLRNTIHSSCYLAITHSSIHETAINEGFEMWNTCAHACALILAGEQYNNEMWIQTGKRIQKAIGIFLTYEGRFIRKLKKNGEPDLRYDMNLMSPFYFGLFAYDNLFVRNSVQAIEDALKYPILGGYTRYITFSIEEMSDFQGAWFFYTAWMAQYYFVSGNRERGDEVLSWIFKHSKNMFLPELIITPNSFEQFEATVMLKLKTLKNRKHRKRSLNEVANLRAQFKQGKEILYSAMPLLWAHVEMLRALKTAGYVQDFSLSRLTEQ